MALRIFGKKKQQWRQKKKKERLYFLWQVAFMQHFFKLRAHHYATMCFLSLNVIIICFRQTQTKTRYFPPMLSENLNFCCRNLTLLFVFGKTRPWKKIVAVVCQFPSIFGLSQGKKLDFAQRFFSLQTSNFNKTKQVTVNNPNRFWRNFGNLHQKSFFQKVVP